MVRIRAERRRCDVNGDNRPDLVVPNWGSGTVGVLLGNGHGGFSATQVYRAGGSGSAVVSVGDFDGNGRPDIAVGNDLMPVSVVLLQGAHSRLAKGRIASNSTALAALTPTSPPALDLRVGPGR